ncbi:MAG: rRNA pseudouridine synthase [Lachnospiraceae bacterium]|nr:rRNA pseudouridine synthase [Lachnospiraceae bacterium]
MTEQRINKYIALCGICSRREADTLIEAKRVTINNQIAEPGSKVKDGDIVMLDGKEVKPEEKKVVAYYKPVGVTCTEADVHANVTLTEAFKYPTRLTYAGRLDEESEGLLLMTNDGDLIHCMMLGSNNHEKEYEVVVDKAIDPMIIDRMQKGLYLYDLEVMTKPCKVVSLSDKSFRITLTQGLNRQIRRMCFECGLDVVSLKRIRVCNIHLGDLKPNEYREIDGEELDELYRMVFNPNESD